VERIGPGLGSRFDEAFAYASELHRSQVRKSTGIPYISHLMSVCALVLEDHGTEDEAIAALHHDGPEDQGGRDVLAEIRRRFGDGVADMVDGLSDTMQTPKPPWRERKEAYLRRLRGEPESVVRICLADKLHNLRTTAADGPDVWDRFNAGKPEQAWLYRELLAVFEERLPDSANLPEFRALVNQVFG
jgi:(p)ppGpp synthase/HD superfamily hydrolase